MTLENRRPTSLVEGSQRAKCRAISSSTALPSEYVLSGRTGYSSSTGAYGGGVSNGRPSTVSLDAHTTLRMPAVAPGARATGAPRPPAAGGGGGSWGGVGVFLGARPPPPLRSPGAGIA